MRMLERGGLSRLRKKWLFLVDEDPCPMDSTLPSFDLNNVALPFYLFIFGSVFSLLVLSIENLVYCAMKK